MARRPLVTDDGEVPELTAAQLAEFRPKREVLRPEFYAILTSGKRPSSNRRRLADAAQREAEAGPAGLLKPDFSRDPAFFALLAGSFARLTGRPLVPEPGLGAEWLYEAAPFAVLAHDGAHDPLFTYANRCAQRVFEYGWDEIVGLPSRFSAEAGNRDARQRLLDAVARDGFVGGYSGLRIAKSGRRFRIADAVIWQLIDTDGAARGQAATFPAP